MKTRDFTAPTSSSVCRAKLSLCAAASITRVAAQRLCSVSCTPRKTATARQPHRPGSPRLAPRAIAAQMKARRHQPRAGEDEEEGQRNASSNEVRYGEKGPLWFPVALGALFLVMVGVLLCLTPQTKQHAWLTLHATPTPPPTENMYLKRPLQQVPGLPPGPRKLTNLCEGARRDDAPALRDDGGTPHDRYPRDLGAAGQRAVPGHGAFQVLRESRGPLPGRQELFVPDGRARGSRSPPAMAPEGPDQGRPAVVGPDGPEASSQTGLPRLRGVRPGQSDDGVLFRV